MTAYTTATDVVESDADQPGRSGGPAEDEVGDGGAAEEGREEADQPDDGRLPPTGAKDLRVEFRAREKGEHYRPCSSEECDPGLLRAVERRADTGPDDELGDGADDDLG
jgi:hypothetical protein